MLLRGSAVHTLYTMPIDECTCKICVLHSLFNSSAAIYVIQQLCILVQVCAQSKQIETTVLSLSVCSTVTTLSGLLGF